MENRIDHMKYMADMEQIDSDIMDRVIDEMNGYYAERYTENDVKAALENKVKTVENFKALLSPAARFRTKKAMLPPSVCSESKHFPCPSPSRSKNAKLG